MQWVLNCFNGFWGMQIITSIYVVNVYYYFFYHLLGDAYRKTRKTCFELLQFCRRVHIANAHCKVKFQPYFGNDPFMTCCHTMTKSGSPPPSPPFKYIFQQSSCLGAGIWRNLCLTEQDQATLLIYSTAWLSRAWVENEAFIMKRRPHKSCISIKLSH